MGHRESEAELDAIIERLKEGDEVALQFVTRENVVRLLEKVDGDENIERLLRKKL
jgi:hypothetical protein